MNREHSQEPERTPPAADSNGQTGQPPGAPKIPRRSFLKLIGLTVPAALVATTEALATAPPHYDINTNAPHKDIGHYDHGNGHTDIGHADINGHTDGTVNGQHIDRPHTDSPHIDRPHTDSGPHIDIPHDDANNFNDHTDF